MRPTPLDTNPPARPKLAVWKFASCDGCQLSLLDRERELLAVTERVSVAWFPEATSAVVDGPYDLSLVEGSISTPEQAAHIRRIRERSATLVTIGACATAGGIQALRNGADVAEIASVVYAEPEYVSTLRDATPIADHVVVDAALRGCPIDGGQLLELLSAYVAGRPPRIPDAPVCVECKARSVTCVMVASGTPCLGPVTHGGCGAICPAFHRGCYGCFGPTEAPDTGSLDAQFVQLGLDDRSRERLWRSFNGWAPAFRRRADQIAGTIAGSDPAG